MLRRAKAPETATRVTRVPKSTRRAPRVIPESPRRGFSGFLPPPFASLTDGGIFQGNGKVHGCRLSLTDQDFAANRTGPLVPSGDGVFPGRQILEKEISFGVGGGEMGIAQDQNDGAHVRMDMAEDPYDPRLVEADRAR